MVVLSNPVLGREQECDNWYRSVHLKEMVKLPGFVSAERFDLAHPMAAASAYQYLAVYHIECDDIEAVINELVTAAEDGTLTMSDALDRHNAYATVYSSAGEAVTGTTVSRA